MSCTSQILSEMSNAKYTPVPSCTIDYATEDETGNDEYDDDDTSYESDSTMVSLPHAPRTLCSNTHRNSAFTHRRINKPTFTPQVFTIQFDGQRASFRATDIVSNPNAITLETLKYEDFRREVESQLHISLDGKHVFANGLDAFCNCGAQAMGVGVDDGLYPANNGTQWRASLQMFHDIGLKRCEFVVLEDVVEKRKGWVGCWLGLLAVVAGVAGVGVMLGVDVAKFEGIW
ncbi:hypothetical protein NX059_008989 [Plenodomus lindquistii]|nr:hypothetical protein NX059_008989 [Plenodomus lindquistii]